jgi:hypothetical protein
MENHISIVSKGLAVVDKETPKRQVLIFPYADSNGTRLILACNNDDMLSTTLEEVQTNNDKFPCIGLIKKDGSVVIDPLYCIDRGYYDNVLDLIIDVNMLLKAHGLPEIDHL